MRLPFRTIEPAFFAGLADDPVLLVQVRPLGRAVLVDCGQLTHLAKRVLRSLDAVFISHAHMDHFMGMDTLARHILVSPRTLEVYGPPGIAGRLAHKLAGYDWNLAEGFWCSFRVREIHPEVVRTFLLPGSEQFVCRFETEAPRHDDMVFANRFLRVRAATGDHRIPVLFFRLDEAAPFAVDPNRLRAAGLMPGPWLQQLKRLFFAGALAGSAIAVPRPAAVPAPLDAAELYAAIRAESIPSSLGYFTDLAFDGANREKLRRLLRGVTLLIGECAYLRRGRERARASCHFCTDDINQLLEELRPAFFLPMHLSKSHLGESARLFEELQAPPGTTILRLPERLTPRPLLPDQLPPAARGRLP